MVIQDDIKLAQSAQLTGGDDEWGEGAPVAAWDEDAAWWGEADWWGEAAWWDEGHTSEDYEEGHVWDEIKPKAEPEIEILYAPLGHPTALHKAPPTLNMLRQQSMCIATTGVNDNNGVWYRKAIPLVALPGGCVPKSPPAPEVERSYGLLKSKVPNANMAVRNLSDTAEPTPNQIRHDPIVSSEQLAFSQSYSP